MYAYNDNGTLRLIGSLPSRLRLPDGLTRTSLDELDSKQLAELGIYPAKEDKPAIDTAKQFYGEPKLSLDGETVIVFYPVLDKTKEQIALEIAEAKQAKLAELAEARWQAETGGLTLPCGTAVKTDRESQALLTGAALKALQDPEYSCWWKADDEWVRLDSKTLLYLAEAVRGHVQSCFDRERQLYAMVEAAQTASEVQSISW